MKLRQAALAAGLLVTAVTFWGCDWSAGGDNGYNTSRAGLEVNVSGIYNGSLSGGRAVSQTSGAPITRFSIYQTGNVLEVTDSNGQQYRGTAGSPGAVMDLTEVDTIPAGVNLASYQIHFAGTDGVAARDVQFTGIIDVVTISEVYGDSTEQTITSTTEGERSTSSSAENTASSSASAESNAETSGSSETTGGETTSIDPETGDVITTGEAMDTSSEESESESGAQESSRDRSTTTETTTTDSAGRETTRTITKTFELTEANTQFRLRGTWVEAGGYAAEVEARSTGSGRLVDSTTEGVAGTPAVETEDN